MVDISELTESVKGYIEGLQAVFYKENIKFQKRRL